MKNWGVTAVRVPLNEACWNAESYVTAADAGANYQAAIKAYVNLLNSNGIVAILDSRLRSKFYGPAFIHSLPPCTVRVGPAAHLVETATHWVGVDAPG